jgi:PleD family two-component response regulator
MDEELKEQVGRQELEELKASLEQKAQEEKEAHLKEKEKEKDAERRKIVYVDDVNFSLITVKERLKSRYEVYPAQSVSIMFNILKQLDEVKDVKPDAILLDLNMPEVDGYEALSMLKADERYSDIPVILLTAQKDKESVIKGIHLGAAAHVGKPFSDQVLTDTIENILDPDARKSNVEEEVDDGRPRILAIDDMPTMLRAINHALGDKYKVYMLSKPAEMKDLLNKITPDLFLLDYNMPVMSGFDLIPIIREFPEHEETPILFLTAEGTVDHLTAAMHMGASDFIVKPFNAKALREKIASYIRRED